MQSMSQVQRYLDNCSHTMVVQVSPVMLVMTEVDLLCVDQTVPGKSYPLACLKASILIYMLHVVVPYDSELALLQGNLS